MGEQTFIPENTVTDLKSVMYA